MCSRAYASAMLDDGSELTALPRRILRAKDDGMPTHYIILHGGAADAKGGVALQLAEVTNQAFPLRTHAQQHQRQLHQEECQLQQRNMQYTREDTRIPNGLCGMHGSDESARVKATEGQGVH